VPLALMHAGYTGTELLTEMIKILFFNVGILRP